MTLGQLIRIARFLNRKPSRTVRTLKVFEPIDRNPRRSSGELQQARFSFGRPGANDFPEPFNHLIIGVIPSIIRVSSPVIAEGFDELGWRPRGQRFEDVHINFTHSTDEELQHVSG